MKLDEAIKILEEHNRWRQGDNIEMKTPKLITESIDVISKNYHAIHNNLNTSFVGEIRIYSPLREDIVFYKSTKGGWVGINADIDGCMSQGETIDELLINLEDAKQSLIKSIETND